eukprot:jgi/Mesvir1/4886/Mv11154-RA.1
MGSFKALLQTGPLASPSLHATFFGEGISVQPRPMPPGCPKRGSAFPVVLLSRCRGGSGRYRRTSLSRKLSGTASPGSASRRSLEGATSTNASERAGAPGMGTEGPAPQGMDGNSSPQTETWKVSGKSLSAGEEMALSAASMMDVFDLENGDKFHAPDTHTEESDWRVPKLESSAPPTSPKKVVPGEMLSGPRSGLFRTPISGGVQTATLSHDLPGPAVAAANLLSQARFGLLCTIMSRMHHRRKGYPFGSLVDYATDEFGRPIFSLSPLAIHTRNVLVDPRCTLVVQVPGWSGLANARIVLFGEVSVIPAEEQEAAKRIHEAKHQIGHRQQWANFTYFKMTRILDIYFVGGFGTVTWVDVNDYLRARPDPIAAKQAHITIRILNEKFSSRLRRLLEASFSHNIGLVDEANMSTVDEASIISIDRQGVDVKVRRADYIHVTRLTFPFTVHTLERAEEALAELTNGIRD